MSLRPRTFPRPWPSVSPRQFSSTPAAPAASRAGAQKKLPRFDWRRPFQDFPRPSVTLIKDVEAANTYLETLTSTRLTIEGDTGFSVNRALGVTRPNSFSEGALTVADGEGVLILHLARMKRAPEVLLSILSDPRIEKQRFVAPWFLNQICNKEAEFFAHVQPDNFIDLHQLAQNLYPRLRDVGGGLPITEFMVEYGKLGMSTNLEVLNAIPDSFRVQRLATDVIDELVNMSWFSHIAGTLLRSRLESKIGQAVEDDILATHASRKLPNPNEDEKEVLKGMLVGKALSSYRWNASRLAR